ncbi:MAG: EamA family transporter [Defluviitaleaceae bacterium]|nr:EamA family transporter [Defluviitaleaceae bacterium]
MWILYAILAAVFAALTSIFAKIGIEGVNSNLATAIRTMVVITFAWVMVFITGAQGGLWYITPFTWIFIVLSGLATGGAWLCRYRALKLGNVNKVTPIGKTSTILTMLLAFLFLGEPMGWHMVIAMALMGVGTWLMLELKKSKGKEAPQGAKSWLLFAILGAVFASLVAILGSVGVTDIDATLWTALRTMIVAILSWLMVFTTGHPRDIKAVSRKSWIFLVLSGMATGGSWLFFYHALQIGNASLVVPIDQLSILLTMGFARVFLGERFTKQSLIGLTLLTLGILFPTIVGMF